LHQVEYAAEAVKQGSAAVGLRSKTHVVLLALKRSSSELSSYQQKLLRIDDHIGIAIAGLTSDARVLSNFMRNQAMASRMLYGRPLPVGRVVGGIADKAQVNTQHYGRRPYGVGFLVAGYDEKGPHLFEFTPAGTCFEYYAMSIGARSQSAKTYLEQHFEEFEDADLETLIKHGLHALRDTLQQDKELNILNTSIGIVGLSPSTGTPIASEPIPVPILPEGVRTTKQPSTFEGVVEQGKVNKIEKFKIIEGEELKVWLDRMDPKESGEMEDTSAAAAVPAEAETETGDEDVAME